MPSLCSVLPVLQDSSWAKRAETTSRRSAASLGRGTKPLFRSHYPFLLHSPATTLLSPASSWFRAGSSDQYIPSSKASNKVYVPRALEMKCSLQPDPGLAGSQADDALESFTTSYPSPNWKR